MKALEFTKELIRFDTTSSVSNTAATDYIETVLRQNGFRTERIEYTDGNGIAKSNVIGKKGPGTGGVACFGHTDVVPADTWFSQEFGPFTPFVQAGRLFGRGSCDMKGGIACMLAAAEQFAASELQHPVYVACTADEEVGYFGAEQVARRSELFREIVAGQSRGIIGEPTELEVVYAHKGGYGIRATARGRAAHSSTRDGINANLAMIPFLAEMKRLYDETESDPKWQDASFDPPTVCWNIGINDFTRAMNITAPQSVCTVYFRPMPGQDTDELVQRARRAADACGLEFEVPLEAPPLYIDPESPFVRDMIALCGRPNPRTVPYGTDGAMFTELKHLVVLGPGSIAQAHTADEWIQLEQLERGTELYVQCIRRWCC